MADRERTSKLGLIGLDIADVPFGYLERVEFTEVMRQNFRILDDNNAGITTAPINLYVDVSGSDANDGSLSSPFLTIQAALNSLPKRIKHQATINVGSGSFAGALISSFDLDGGSLWILGSMKNAILTTGAPTGSITNVTNGSGATWATIQDTSQNWTIDELRGKWVTITGPSSRLGLPRMIASNTSDTLTVVGTFTASTKPSVGDTYQIETTATSINVQAPTPTFRVTDTQTAFYISAVSAPVAQTAYAAVTTARSNPLLIDGFGINLDGVSFLSGVILSNSQNCTLSRLNVTYSGNGGSAVFIDDLSSATVIDSYIDPKFQLFSSSSKHKLYLTRNIFIGSGATYALQGAWDVNSQSNYYYGTPSYWYYSVYSQMYVLSVYDRFDGQGGGVAFAGTFSTAGSFYINQSNISNMGTAINVISGQIAHIISVAGTGNTVGINVSKGAKAAIWSGTTLTGTTEIVLDGVNHTLAEMRAASPKVIKDANYGSIVFE